MQSARVEYHAAASAELTEATRWYTEHSAAVAAAFVAQVDIALARIVAEPNAWRMLRGGARRFPLDQFPFGVVYRHSTEGIRIVAIAHAKRRPGYWRDR